MVTSWAHLGQYKNISGEIAYDGFNQTTTVPLFSFSNFGVLIRWGEKLFSVPLALRGARITVSAATHSYGAKDKCTSPRTMYGGGGD